MAKVKKPSLPDFKNMSEKEFDDYIRKQYNKYMSSIYHSDDEIPYYEYYMELNELYRGKK